LTRAAQIVNAGEKGSQRRERGVCDNPAHAMDEAAHFHCFSVTRRIKLTSFNCQTGRVWFLTGQSLLLLDFNIRHA
jgi:hypothetical protein